MVQEKIQCSKFAYDSGDGGDMIFYCEGGDMRRLFPGTSCYTFGADELQSGR